MILSPQQQSVLVAREAITYLSLRRCFKDFTCIYAYRNGILGGYEPSRFSEYKRPYSFLGLEVVKGDVDFYKFKHSVLLEASRLYEFQKDNYRHDKQEELWFSYTEIGVNGEAVITLFKDEENSDSLRSVYLETFVGNPEATAC